MRTNCFRCICFLPLVLALGCGAGSQPTAIDASEVQKYLDENPEEAARQAKVNRASEGGGDEDE